MKSGLLIYRFPNELIFSIQAGNWIWSPELEQHAFFMTAFDQPGFYIFKDGASIDFESVPNYLSKSKFSTIDFLTKSDYLSQLEQLLMELSQNKVEKVVFSRISKEQIADANDLELILNRLAKKYGDKALIYAISSPELGTWVGATPEILLAGSNGVYSTMSLAGTKRDADTEWTSKEEREQQMVTDFIVQKLKDQQIKEFYVEGPHTFYTGAVYHLKSIIRFRALEHQLTELVTALNPTPAVCGLPRSIALSMIHAYESHERSLYTGMIGKMDAASVQLFVNLRCMQLIEGEMNAAAVYVGGGITAESNPEAEWEETVNKATTLKN
jgi:isochorismate synthase